MSPGARIAAASGCAFLILAHSHAMADDAPSLATEESLQAAFAPWDNLEDLIAQAIGAAKKQILMQAYLLTSKKIAATLIEAQRRGIDVRILADAEQESKVASSKASELAAAGIPIWLETKYQNAHNKIIVIDAYTKDATVITGSYNFTWSAQNRNAENILIVRKNPELAARYAANWERHKRDATPYRK